MSSRMRAMLVASSSLMLMLVAGGSPSCAPDTPQTGSQTNWYRLCDADDQCGELRCICSTCTLSCQADDACSDRPGATCVDASEAGAVALCGGSEPKQAGLCLDSCEDVECDSGSACQAGVCVPVHTATTTITIDETQTFQTLLGIGATIGLSEEQELSSRTDKQEVFDGMFSDSGLDVLRLLNRYDPDAETDMSISGELFSAAVSRLGRPPLVLLTSKSPPPALKENGSQECSLADPAGCTLVRDGAGNFDYAAFAAHWLSSVQAYQAAGVAVDFIGVQDKPDLIPAERDPGWACRFLPKEGTTTVTTADGDVTLDFPGLTEAIAAVDTELSGLSDPPRIVAPEATGVITTTDFAGAMDLSGVDALGHHLYGVDLSAMPSLLAALSDLAKANSKPNFQTEMRAEGEETALLMQRSFIEGEVSVYLQNDFVASSSATDGDPSALLSLKDQSFEFELPYYVLRQFARWTDPGFVRIGVDCSDAGLTCTAWISPDQDALTLVILNDGTEVQDAKLELSLDLADRVSASEVHRTVFGGVERGAALGELLPGDVVSVPPGSLVTVAWSL